MISFEFFPLTPEGRDENAYLGDEHAYLKGIQHGCSQIGGFGASIL